MPYQPDPNSIELLANGDEGAVDCWRAWSFAIVTCWCRPETAQHTLEWLATAEIPPKSALYWLDNSGGSMDGLLRAAWEQKLRSRFSRVVWMKGGQPFRSEKIPSALNPMRHVHIARLYRQLLTPVEGDALLILEDDMVPPPGGLRALVDVMQQSDRIGLVAGVYRDRPNPDKICVALNQQDWRDAPFYDALPAEPFGIGMTGGGFTLYRTQAVKQAPPVRCKVFPEGYALGWDGNLCVEIAALGYRLLAHPGVMCRHLCPEIDAYEAGLRR